MVSVSPVSFKSGINFFSIHKKQKSDDNSVKNSENNLDKSPQAIYSKADIKYKKHDLNHYKGCLTGGAAGDALGAPVEFDLLKKIRTVYGEDGITDFVLNDDGIAEFTDDTQMSIFTADGIIKSARQNFNPNKIPDMNIVYSSYCDWINTQYGYKKPESHGWISQIDDLYSMRSPGLTCTGSLKSGKIGSIEKPLNNSKGCGGIMRVAPVGLMYYENPEVAFETGARCAAITHGSPDAYLPAGVHAAIIANIIQGKSLEDSISDSLEILKKYDNHENVLKLATDALIFAHSDVDSDVAIRCLGEGWHGDEALAISLYCAVKEQNNPLKAIILAVNHSGDSDSTGSITGNILGAYHGENAFPQNKIKNLELIDQIRTIAEDLYSNPHEIKDGDIRYPLN